MRVKELNRDQIIELKQRYYTQNHTNTSYEELVTINELVSDDEIYSAYDDIEFSSDDFFCNSNNKHDREEEEL